MSCRGTVHVAVHQLRCGERLGPWTVVIRAVHRWSRITDRRPLTLSSSVRGWHAGERMVSTNWCQHALSQDVAVHWQRLELDTQQQAAAKPCEDCVCLMRPTSSTPPHSHLRRTSLQRPNSSCSVGQRSGRVCQWSHGDEDPHQPRVVILFQCSEADQIHQVGSAGTRTNHSGHFPGIQSAWLL